MLTKCSGLARRKLILIKGLQSKSIEELIRYYGDDFTAVDIESTSATLRKQQIADISETTPKTQIVLCADTDMFKTLCKVTKVSGLDGYPMDSPLGKTFLVPNFIAALYNPTVNVRIDFIMDKVNKYLNGEDISFTKVINVAHYCTTEDKAKELYKELHKHPEITIDIETCSIVPEDTCNSPALHHMTNTIVSIGFAWSEHCGGSVYVYKNDSMLDLLKEFLDTYKGTCIYHNSSFDILNLIYHLYMQSPTDYSGMLVGLHKLCSNYHDTKHIAYLCLNSCGNVDLGLKTLSHEFAGNYAQDEIADCSKIPIDQLLEYNLTDCCATWFVFNKYYPMLATENQLKIYQELFLPAQKVLIETQLVGLRIDIPSLTKLNDKLNQGFLDISKKIHNNLIIQAFNKRLQDSLIQSYNASHTKQVTDISQLAKLSTYADKLIFNPRSDKHMGMLLYEVLKLPVVDVTKSNSPATGAKTIAKLINNAPDDSKELLQNLIDLASIDIIINTFLTTFNEAPTIDGQKAVYGSFNLGGTKTGRLSSSNPNLQNLPSTGSAYAKPVKEVFVAPKGYVFCGADQRSLIARRVA